MFAGIIITDDGNAQIFGEVDLEKLSAAIEQLLPQIKQGADKQRKDRLTKLLNEVDRTELEAALKHKVA